MSTKVGLLALFLAAGCISAGLAQQPPKKQPPKAASADEVAIRAAIDSYVKAFNAADAEKVAAHWSESAVYLRPNSGEKAVGRKAIAKVFSEIFSGPDRVHLKVSVDSIRLITPEVAIEDGTAHVVTASGDEERSTYTAVHVKGKDGWKLDSVRETDAPAEDAAAEGPEQLRQLEWLLGDWVDASDDSVVEYSAHFAKNHSFIVRLFKVSAPGAEDLEGTQIIGWDAATRSIRSWVFDSQGGFSEGLWSRQGSTWTIKSKGYVADGRRTSSVGTFTQVSDRAFTWSLTDRQIAGQKLPDIAEIKIVRK